MILVSEERPSDDEVMMNGDTSDNEAREMLRAFCDNGFDGNTESAALVLGRPEQELRSMLDGSEDIDEDLLMKLRGIAHEREIDIGIIFPDPDQPGEEVARA
jgi:hypothetical protein